MNKCRLLKSSRGVALCSVLLLQLLLSSTVVICSPFCFCTLSEAAVMCDWRRWGGGRLSVCVCMFPRRDHPPPELERRVVGLFFAMQLIIRASTGLCVGDGQTVNETWTPPKLSKLILHPCAKSESQRCVQILADNVNVWFFFLFFGQIWCRNCKCLFCFFFWEALLKVFRSPNDTREICKKKKKK